MKQHNSYSIGYLRLPQWMPGYFRRRHRIDRARCHFLGDHAALAAQINKEPERRGSGRKEARREILDQRDEEEIAKADPGAEEEPKSDETHDCPEKGEDRLEADGPERKRNKSLPQFAPARFSEEKEQNQGCHKKGQTDSRQEFLHPALLPFSISAPGAIVKGSRPAAALLKGNIFRLIQGRRKDRK
jgi:hypothetical protein